TTGAHPTNLPARLEPLIGRDAEVATLRELLQRDDVFLVTLTGPGGTGKTRLAVATGAELLDSFADGVFFVDLSATTDASLVLAHIAQSLSLKETPGRSLADTLTDHLAAKEILLILDNLEQVIDAAQDIAALLTSAAGLKVLATSREALRIAGERVFSVAPLEAPPQDQQDLEELGRYPAVALFTERARAAKADFSLTQDNATDVAAICRRLDGLPLAIELAAARVSLLSPSALLARLDKGLKLLTSGRRDAAERQRTLRAAIEWSYGLLTEDEQTLFRRLGVFAGGWTLEAAEAVCDRGDLDADVLAGLASLVDKSLVRVGEHDEERFSMLETIREFAAEKLEESGEAKATRRAHAEFFRSLAEQSYAGLAGPRQVSTLQHLRREGANFRIALRWASAAEPQISLHLCSNLWRFWRIEGQLAEGRDRLEKTLDVADAPSAIRARALRGLSVIAEIQHDHPTARLAAHEAMTLFDELGDEGGIARCLEIIAGLSEEEGDLEGAAIGYSRTKEIYERIGDEHGVAVALGNLANVPLLREDDESALELTRASLELYERQGDVEGKASSLLNRGLALLGSSTPYRSRPSFRHALARAVELHHTHLVIVALEGLAAEASMANRLERAGRLLGAANQLRSDEQVPRDSLEQRFYVDTLRRLRERFDPHDLDGLFGEGCHRVTDIVISEARADSGHQCRM
ncbi:MAG: hypothetical protein LC808_06765, partial [Actinobacteria bacterium]|nr:hypothetical protein [Actinomycetota bacterium]